MPLSRLYFDIHLSNTADCGTPSFPSAACPCSPQARQLSDPESQLDAGLNAGRPPWSGTELPQACRNADPDLLFTRLWIEFERNVFRIDLWPTL